MTTVTFDNAVVAMKAIMATYVAYTVTYENEGAVASAMPEPPGPRVYCEFRHVGGDQMSIGSPGSNFHEDMGAMIAYAFVPVGSGDQLARQICDAIVALFRGITNATVEITHIGGDDGGGVDEDGNWWRRWRRIEFMYRLEA